MYHGLMKITNTYYLCLLMLERHNAEWYGTDKSGRIQIGVMTMEIRVLRYFLAVVQEGTITGASRVLHVTQPTLSRQLMELEDELERLKKLYLSL